MHVAQTNPYACTPAQSTAAASIGCKTKNGVAFVRDTSGECTLLPLLVELAKHYYPDVEVNLGCTVLGYLIEDKSCAAVVGTINQVRTPSSPFCRRRRWHCMGTTQRPCVYPPALYVRLCWCMRPAARAIARVKTRRTREHARLQMKA